jgi:16S rRNA (uracil1498-N3)-methyltransferase
VAHLYIADELAQTVVGATIELTGSEARHASSVSRLRLGEHVLVTNGKGLLVEGEAIDVGKDVVRLRVVTIENHSRPSCDVVLVQALAKGDRDERAIEMATELGVTSIVPWQSARSVSRWEGDKAAKGQARWQAIVREASKQSIRSWIPSVAEVASTKDVVGDDFAGLTLVLDPSGGLTVSNALASDPEKTARGIRLIVGPEGGLTPEEVDLFSSYGALVVGLGSNILRTSTAGPAVLAVINELSERW